MSLGWFNPIEPSNHTITDVLRSLPWFCGSSTLPKLWNSKGCKIKERTFGYLYTTTGKVWESLGQFDLTLWRCRHTGKVQVSSGQFDLFCHGDSYSTYWYNAIIIGPSRKQSVQALSPDISFPAGMPEWYNFQCVSTFHKSRPDLVLYHTTDYCVYIIREEEHQDEENKCRADSVRNSMTHSLFRR